jgi:outer membrane biosynthesis protein TonB
VNQLKEMWKDKDRRRGLIATTLVHILILFALFFLALRTPLPLPGEAGVEVNLGYDEQGVGNIQSESAPPESQPTPPPQPVPQEIIEPEPEIIEEEIVTQDIEEAPVIEEEIVEDEPEEIIEEPKEEPEPEKEPEIIEEEIVEELPEKPVDSTFVSETEELVEEVVEEPKPVVNQRALYPGTSTNKTGTNQGNTQGAGDMGKPQGYKDSDKYDGRGGEGNGPSFYLGGRGGKYIETPSVKVTERGTVTVDIWVDRQGNVAKAQINYKGTDVIDAQQRKIAVDAALNSKFDEDPSAPEQQRGTISYTFILMK